MGIPQMPESVTYVSGILCYPSARMGQIHRAGRQLDAAARCPPGRNRQNVPLVVVLEPPLVEVTVQLSPVVGCGLPPGLICAANVRPVPVGSVWPAASVHVYVTCVAVVFTDCVIAEPPMVLY